MSGHVSTINIINHVFDYYLGPYIKLDFSLKNRASGKESCGGIILPGSMRIGMAGLLSLILVIHCWLHP